MNAIRSTLTFAIIILAHAALLPSSIPAKDSARGMAVVRAVSLIEKSAATYVDKRECFSCHHQALAMMAMSRAKLSGIELQPDSLSTQVQFSLEYFGDRRKRLLKGEGVPGGAYNAGYALTGLAATGTPKNEVTKALVQYLLKTEHKDGGWRIRTHRPPLEDSHFTATALAIKGIAEFAKPADKTEPTKRALAWLKKTSPKSTEDHAFKVLGLHWGEATIEKQKAAEVLLELQSTDGGWSQTKDMKSDAYATGLALSALRQSGALTANSPQYKSGVKWLLDHQEPDGSWRVKTRSKPIQKYFESSFPHGKDQFISICATCWAVIELSE
ncbi:MAG: terpene cyclase/mutase family protein [Opitutae bacterium]|nr:terpene cyclase/mutase family protein [Opitutae bacterium]